VRFVVICFRLEDGEDACTEARYELKEKNKVNPSMVTPWLYSK
jgi:hypothetical protein